MHSGSLARMTGYLLPSVVGAGQHPVGRPRQPESDPQTSAAATNSYTRIPRQVSVFPQQGRIYCSKPSFPEYLRDISRENRCGVCPAPESDLRDTSRISLRGSRERVPRFLPIGGIANKTGTFRGLGNDADVILRSDTDVVSFALFTFDRTVLPEGNSRLLAQRNALVTEAMAEVGAILWDTFGV